MKTLVFAAGREFLKAFGASLVVLIPGILSAPNLDDTLGLATAAIFASLAAGFKVVQVFVPQLSFAEIVPQPIAAWVDAFVRAGLAAFLTSIIGILSAPDLSNSKALITAALVGALAAAFRALEGLTTQGETPVTTFGLVEK